jgi:hypothetical protein
MLRIELFPKSSILAAPSYRQPQAPSMAFAAIQVACPPRVTAASLEKFPRPNEGRGAQARPVSDYPT